MELFASKECSWCTLYGLHDITWLLVACWHLRDYRQTSYSLNFHSWRHIGQRWLVCWECNHFMMQCMWKQCEHWPQTGTVSKRVCAINVPFFLRLTRHAHLPLSFTTGNQTFFGLHRHARERARQNVGCRVRVIRFIRHTDRYTSLQLRKRCRGILRTVLLLYGIISPPTSPYFSLADYFLSYLARYLPSTNYLSLKIILRRLLFTVLRSTNLPRVSRVRYQWHV